MTADSRHPTTSIRLPAEVREALQRAADGQQRNLSNMALYVLVQWLLREGYLQLRIDQVSDKEVALSVAAGEAPADA